MSYYDSHHGRPDRELRVECTFDRRTKRIRFRSSANCSMVKLRKKVEEAFSELRGVHSYAIRYKDDDGEITEIWSEDELTEAIYYFQAGLDDAPISSAASILSGFSGGSFTARQCINIQVHVFVDYEGGLSDNGSLAPSDEFGDRRRSMDSFSLNGSLSGGMEGPLDDDQVTISSRDRVSQISKPVVTRYNAPGSISLDGDDRVSYLARDEQAALRHAPNRDSFVSETSSYAPSKVFENLRRQEDRERTHGPFNTEAPLVSNPRGAAWLADQNRLAKEGLLGKKPTPSEVDRGSIRLSMDSVPPLFTPDGDLALERDRRGKYYYSYTSSASSHSQAQEYRPRDSIASSSALSRAHSGGGHRPHSVPMPHLPSIPEPSHESGGSASNSELREVPPSIKKLQAEHPDIPLEYLLAEHESSSSSSILPSSAAYSQCSACTLTLDALRYVCATCGPRNKSEKGSNGEHGKGKDFDAGSMDSGGAGSPSLMPPMQWGGGANSSASRSSQTLVANGHASHDHRLRLQTSLASMGRTPTLASGTPPGQSPVTTLHSPGSVHSHGSSAPEGYELCNGCIESVGVVHALEAGAAATSLTSLSLGADHGHGGHTLGHGVSPSDSHRSFSEWKRTAPRLKGQLRHAYLEQLLGPDGWQTISHEDEGKPSKCSTCANTIRGKRYKCLSCPKFELCRSCYSQVHEIHPSHVFLEVLYDKDSAGSRSETDSIANGPSYPNGNANGHAHDATAEDEAEPSLSHGVKCAHCMLEIVGARFHCAICEDVDICSNCESAGLPGDLESADGGHSSKHIMIKIPVPLETNKVESLSRQTVHLWTGRDAPHLGGEQPRSRERSGSVYSNHRTVVAPTAPPSLTRAVVDGETNNHNLLCDNCEEVILGVRYQCASCPSSPNSYNLCEQCEQRSYIVHNSTHIFFKLPRPVHRSLQSAMPFLPALYKKPAGPTFGNADLDPKEYLRSLLHLSIACDLCIERIQGEWYWCVYCGKDLCDAHEAIDTHDNTHVFVVFKSEVDMQAFRRFAESDTSPGQPRVVPYPVYLA